MVCLVKLQLFHWTDCGNAFSALKSAHTEPPVLALPDLDETAKPSELWTDTSGSAVGAILMQNSRVITFRRLPQPKRYYGVGEHELLSVKYALTINLQLTDSRRTQQIT